MDEPRVIAGAREKEAEGSTGGDEWGAFEGKGVRRLVGTSRPFDEGDLAGVVHHGENVPGERLLEGAVVERRVLGGVMKEGRGEARGVAVREGVEEDLSEARRWVGFGGVGHGPGKNGGAGFTFDFVGVGGGAKSRVPGPGVLSLRRR